MHRGTWSVSASFGSLPANSSISPLPRNFFWLKCCSQTAFCRSSSALGTWLPARNLLPGKLLAHVFCFRDLFLAANYAPGQPFVFCSLLPRLCLLAQMLAMLTSKSAGAWVKRLRYCKSWGPRLSMSCAVLKRPWIHTG